MIQILVHDRLAENEAQEEVWETGLERPLMFQRNPDGVILGLHDFEWRKSYYTLRKTKSFLRRDRSWIGNRSRGGGGLLEEKGQR